MEDKQSTPLDGKVQEFLAQTQEFTKFLREQTDELKSKNKAYAIMETLKFMVGDYKWVLSPSQVHQARRKGEEHRFNLDKVYIAPRAKFNQDGTDNRLELTPESLLEIRQEHIKGIAYGDVSRSYLGRNGEEDKWWYKTSYSDEGWTDAELIGDTKEQLLIRWGKKLELLRDAYFENHYAEKEKERQRRILEAKRVLEQEGK